MSKPAGRGPHRREVALGLAAAAGLAAAPAPLRAQIAGLEVIAAGPPGDGQDQLARAIAEGLALTQLTPRAMAINEPREIDVFSDFLDGKRPRAALMVFGLSTIGVLHQARAGGLIDRCRPMCRVLGEHLPLVVPATSKLRDVAQLVEAIRKDAASVTWAGRMKGSADHMLALRLTRAAGGDVSRLAYTAFGTTAEASNHVLKGEVTVGVGALVEFIAQIRGGTLRPLALASPQRADGLDIPTLKETGIDLAMLNWRGLVSRDAVGRALIDRYGEAIAKVVKTPGWGSLMRQRNWVDLYLPENDFAGFIAREREQAAAVLAGA